MNAGKAKLGVGLFRRFSRLYILELQIIKIHIAMVCGTQRKNMSAFVEFDLC
jgi:hypothetical protein